MKIVVFGATGGTGREVVTQALEAGHDVTAVARNPLALEMEHPHLTVVRGDVMRRETILAPVRGQDVVVSSIGVLDRTPTRLYSVGVMNILLAMHDAGVKRLICVTASGLDPGPLIAKIIAKPILWTLFKEGFTDMVRMETIVKATDMDWTIVRPPRLTNNERTGKYNVAIEKPLRRGFLLARADLADFIVKHLADPATNRATVEIAS